MYNMQVNTLSENLQELRHLSKFWSGRAPRHNESVYATALSCDVQTGFPGGMPREIDEFEFPQFLENEGEAEALQNSRILSRGRSVDFEAQNS